ncbi:alkaline phosphatase-like [Lineus longissimus]|uniref:alkaline phosphatase-like n=1 Tax=Lineus longissimus TaxID=88925 RepID=UPI002B4C8AB6
MDSLRILGCFFLLCGLFFPTGQCFQGEDGQQIKPLVKENERKLEPKENWMKAEQEDLLKSLRIQDNYGVAKNTILFIGDGMGISTLTAMRILKGQKKGNPGEEERLNFEDFPALGLAKTYATDRQIAESGTTGSAIQTGVKTRYNLLAYDDTVEWANCSSENPEAQLPSLRDWAEEAGKSTGIVTTARINHATPAGAYAKTCSRKWEDDSNLPPDALGKCKDIAAQLIERGQNITVLLGGGRRGLMPETEADPEYPSKTGRRKDGRNLIEEWKKDKANRQMKAKYVWNKEDFDSIDVSKTDYLMGLFENSHMMYELDREKDAEPKEPSIAEMTNKAIRMLQKNDKGFFLLVEGARIDHGHHAGKARLAIEDGVAFEEAVGEALKLTDPKDTLIVVTADHSHVFMMGGYPPRGNPLFGLTTALPGQDKEPATDKMPYTTIVYGNGPGYALGANGRANITGVNTSDPNYKAQAPVPVVDETHSAEDVAIYALGPMAHLFHGLHDNAYIAHVMSYAACMGPNKDHCEKPKVVTLPSGLTCITDPNNLIHPLLISGSESDVTISLTLVFLCVSLCQFFQF